MEKALEMEKIDLAIKSDFTLIHAFGMLDSLGKGFVTPAELREVLA